ncbi:hypothetical protein BGZ94_002761 [Podila epigama]|nr:hypothetical protein BGZ94_002761 [Podila epigama]
MSPPVSATTEPSCSSFEKRKKVPLPRLPEPAKRIPRPLTLHNETLIDNYRWMHQIEKDPDVKAYIEAESQYLKSWIYHSGVERLQKQLETEIDQIKNGISTLDHLNAVYTGDDHDNNKMSNLVEGQESLKKKTKHRLEGAKFWDIDRWRYWLDSSEGDYGVYKRRPIPDNGYYRAMERKRSEYMSTLALDNEDMSDSNSHDDQQPMPWDIDQFGGCSNGAQTMRGSFASEKEAAEVQVVLDINRIAKEYQQYKDFAFGTIEVQPRATFLRRSIPSTDDITTTRPKEPDYMFVAYSFDIVGDERYKIKLATIDNAQPGPGHVKSDQSGQSGNSGECARAQVPLDMMLENAGPDVRWLKIGRSLYLYYTKLDSKGLAREVWRVLVESFDNTHCNGRKGEEEPTPELVLREEDERNVVGLSITNDRRFLLIESKGQTTSRVYFWSIDEPRRGWNLVRESEDGVMYNVEHHTGYFYIRTNHGDSFNFKVIRIPVAYLNSTGTQLVEPIIAKKPDQQTPSSSVATQSRNTFFPSRADEIAIEHDSKEFLERFESFVENFVAWIWRDGLQEIRIYHVPHPGGGDDGHEDEKWPLNELQRVRPYNNNSRVATIMPGTIRDEEERLMRNFYSTRLRYSNSSFVHPWALYEFDMHTLTPSMATSDMEPEDGDEKVRNATRLVCRESFPVNVQYGKKGRDKMQVSGDIESRLEMSDHQDMTDALFEKDGGKGKDPTVEQDNAIAKFKEQRIMVPSTHGTMNDSNGNEVPVLIPVSLVYYDLGENNFPRPAFVKSYGAYGTLTSAMFEPEVLLPMLHRGLVFVQVYPRGDGVMGPAWYENGKGTKKINTFYDVEDVLLYLRDSGMVLPGKVAIEGRSPGGLVSGWMANRWGENPIPLRTIGGGGGEQDNIVKEMVKVVLAQVPFFDVIASTADKDIPWAEYEWAEWGSPLESKEVFEVMKRYSPYDRIRNQPYPAMMISGGITDARVSYAEPLKFVAKLRSVDGKTNDCQRLDEQDRDDDDDDQDDIWQDKEDEDEDEDEASSTALDHFDEWIVSEKNKKKHKEMCGSKKETPLLLQIEEGGHFSGQSSLWMAFALHQLGATKVVTG